jgi:hypothetical protein
MGVVSIIIICVVLGMYTLYDSISSYKKGVFKNIVRWLPTFTITGKTNRLLRK